MEQTRGVVSSQSLVVYWSHARRAHGGTLEGDPHESEKRGSAPGPRMGLPVPRRRNWKPWGEVM